MPCLRLGWGPYLFGGAAVSPAEAVSYRINRPQTFSDRAASEYADDIWAGIACYAADPSLKCAARMDRNCAGTGLPGSGPWASLQRSAGSFFQAAETTRRIFRSTAFQLVR